MPVAPAGDARPPRTLLLRLSAVGDVVHTLPAAAALAAAGHEVVWAVQPAARPLVAGNPTVAETVAIPARRAPFAALLAARRALRNARADVALDLQGLWKSAGWAWLSGAPRRVGFDGSGRKEPSSALLLTERRAPAPGVLHVIDRNLDLLGAVGVDAVGARDFPLPPHDRERGEAARTLAGLGLERPILLHPGGGWASKLWPAERFGELAARLGAAGIPTLVSWGPGEEALAGRVVDASDGSARLAPATSLLGLAALAEASRAIVAADTGPLHLAAATGTPVVALFGPTDPARNGPWNADDVVVARRPPCFPCHRRDCAIHAGVLDAIPADEVERAVALRLARAAGSARS